MRLVIVALLGLIAGLGGGIGAAWMRNKPAPEPAPAAAVAVTDSAGMPATSDCPPLAHADSVQQTTDSTAVKAASPAHAEPARIATDTAAARKAQAGAAADSMNQRLVRIMAAMKPADAARALVPLEDSQVEAVLFGLNERKAAAILGSFPADRAAKLMQSILAGRAP